MLLYYFEVYTMNARGQTLKFSFGIVALSLATNSNNDLTTSFNSECSKLRSILVLPSADFTARYRITFKNPCIIILTRKMVKKTRGLMAAKKLEKRRTNFKFSRKGSMHKSMGTWKKYDPLEGAPMASGIVIRKKNVEIKQPHSGLRKCAVVQLIKNGKTVTAFMPGVGALKHVDEHDNVIIQRIGGPQKRSAGDMPGVKFKVIKVNNISLQEIVRGRKEKKK